MKRCRLGLHRWRWQVTPQAWRTFLLIGVSLRECEQCGKRDGEPIGPPPNDKRP